MECEERKTDFGVASVSGWPKRHNHGNSRVTGKQNLPIRAENTVKFLDIQDRLYNATTISDTNLTEQDINDLQEIANAGTLHSLFACLELRRMGYRTSCLGTVSGEPSLNDSVGINSTQQFRFQTSDDINVADSSWLEQNIPNPFNTQTEIAYVVADTIENARIVIYENVSGRVIKEFKLTPGKGSVIFRTEDLSSGIYFYNLLSESRILDRKKMVLLR